MDVYIEPKKLLDIELRDGSLGRIEAFEISNNGSLRLLVSMYEIPFYGWISPNVLKPL